MTALIGPVQFPSANGPSPIEAIAPMIPQQADNDAQVIGLWLHGRSRHTARSYRSDVRRFDTFANEKPLKRVTLQDLQDFTDSLTNLADSSRARTIASIKSLLAFAHKIGYLSFNVGAAVDIPKVKNTLAERILSESDVHQIFALEPKKRNRVLLRTLYYAGLRVSELCGLCWRDLKARGETEGQLTAFGKGSKTRAILLPACLWSELLDLRDGAEEDEPVFRSRSNAGALDPSQVMRVVRAAASRVGIKSRVSPHWLRHAHASHALDRGAPIHLVQATLGHASVSTTGRYLHARPTESSSKYLAV